LQSVSKDGSIRRMKFHHLPTPALPPFLRNGSMIPTLGQAGQATAYRAGMAATPGMA